MNTAGMAGPGSEWQGEVRRGRARSGPAGMTATATFQRRQTVRPPTTRTLEQRHILRRLARDICEFYDETRTQPTPADAALAEHLLARGWGCFR